MNDISTEVNVVADELYLGKVVRDGKVAVLYSPEYGAGWSTWDMTYGEALIFDPTIVKYVEEDNLEALEAYVLLKYPNFYTGGMHNLTIKWIPVGTEFRIDEYDGNESVVTRDQDNWFVA